MLEQVVVVDPSLKYLEDIDIFAKYRDRHQLMHFIMVFPEHFEPICAVFLNRSPIPSFDVVVKELISKRELASYLSHAFSWCCFGYLLQRLLQTDQPLGILTTIIFLLQVLQEKGSLHLWMSNQKMAPEPMEKESELVP